MHYSLLSSLLKFFLLRGGVSTIFTILVKKIPIAFTSYLNKKSPAFLTGLLIYCTNNYYLYNLISPGRICNKVWSSKMSIRSFMPISLLSKNWCIIFLLKNRFYFAELNCTCFIIINFYRLSRILFNYKHKKAPQKMRGFFISS